MSGDIGAMLLFGVLFVAFFGWLIVSALRSGTVYGGRGGPSLINRDDDPVSFWTRITVYAVFGFAIAALVARAVFTRLALG